MFEEALIARCVRAAFLGSLAGLSLASLPVAAQVVQQGERVEVTGSNIRRVESETASPVQTVTREEIDRSGKTSVAELLQTLSVDNSGSVPTTFGSGFASGAAGISLRGLGTASTLVLLNGRRIAPYALADDGQKVFSDLNLIPLEAVERVEILKDGGSSIYGSDAIAGVVNIILRKDFVGTTIRGSVGQALKYGDGRDTKISITNGFGNLDTDKYNVLFNFEYGKKEPVFNSNRTDRKWVGKSDLRPYGYDADSSAGVNGGAGAIISGGGTATASIIGNVRDPASLNYFSRDNLSPGTGFTRTFPGARCSNLTDHPQGDPGGGCLIDSQQQYGQISPKSENFNFFTRGSLQINDSTLAYAEANYYDDRSRAQTTPSSVSSSTGFPGGPVSNAAVALGATHPDNPYFGTVARLRYLASDVGPRVSAVDSQFTRFLVGLRGTAFGWDYDTGALYSRSLVSNVRSGYLQRDVAFALLNPSAANVAAARAGSAAYAALPAGTVWRIGENSGLNSAALYQALSPKIANDAKSVTSQLDAKASHEFGQLPGGPLAVAVGTEVRHETVELEPTAGTERGNIVGLGYSAYDGGRTVTAVYGEVVAPVLKTLELSAAARGDHYSDVGNSFTPKGGIKWTPIPQLAIRGTFQKGFRAPSPAENGVGGLAAFTAASDPVRCNLGITAGCSAGNVAVITSPNPTLRPERSKTYTGGFVLDPTRDTSIAVDYFKIVRKNEINQETVDSAILAGHVSRDPSTALASVPGDPGIITAVLANYINSPGTTVRGVDLDGRQNFNLGGGYGKITIDLKWTHIFAFVRTDPDGSVRDFAGTHGNCDSTNCIGTPADRVNLGVTYSIGPVSVATIANFRSALKNTYFKNDPAGCSFIYADGSDAPSNCRIGSFTTWDLSARWQATRNWQVFGSVQNLFNKIPPLDPTTYGEVSFNPLDFQGAVGRFVSVGARYKF